MILNGRKLIGILPLSDLYSVYHKHRRLKVFVNKGRQCVTCDREGVLLLETLDNGGGKHIDLYTDDFVLMTVDHIVPKAVCKKAGWPKKTMEKLSNKQTMCEPCNGKKGSTPITNNQFRNRRLQNGYPQRRILPDVVAKLVDNENIFNKCLEGVT